MKKVVVLDLKLFNYKTSVYSKKMKSQFTIIQDLNAS